MKLIASDKLGELTQQQQVNHVRVSHHKGGCPFESSVVFSKLCFLVLHRHAIARSESIIKELPRATRLT
jgi:hypothetical protein